MQAAIGQWSCSRDEKISLRFMLEQSLLFEPLVYIALS